MLRRSRVSSFPALAGIASIVSVATPAMANLLDLHELNREQSWGRVERCMADAVCTAEVTELMRKLDALRSKTLERSALLVFRYETASPWDYGVGSLPMDAFDVASDCEGEARRLDEQSLVKPTTLAVDTVDTPDPESRYVCQAVSTESERMWSEAFLAWKIYQAVAAAVQKATLEKTVR